MSDNVENAMLEILKRIQADLSGMRQELSVFQRETQAGFARVDEQMRLHRRNSAGMLVMMRATAGDFDERVREVEERVDALDRKGA